MKFSAEIIFWNIKRFLMEIEDSENDIRLWICSPVYEEVWRNDQTYIVPFETHECTMVHWTIKIGTQAYRLTEYNFNFQCKQKIKLTCLLGYLFIQSFFTFFGLRSSWSYVIFLQMNVWRRKNDENLFFSWLFFLRAASFYYCRFLLWFYIWRGSQLDQKHLLK